MAPQYIGIEYDRSHLQSTYEPKFFYSLQEPLDSIDLAVLLINLVALITIIAIFLCKGWKM